MDDKVFIFMILIPAAFLLVTYYLMKFNPKGKKLFWIIAVCFVAANIIYILVRRHINSLEPEPKYDLTSGVIYLGRLYGCLLALLFFAILYRNIYKK